MEDTMLTTIDNPWNPFTQFDEWFNYDLQHGYNTCGLLARKAAPANSLNDEINEKFIDLAMKEICDTDLRGIFVIVSPKSYDFKPFKPVELL